MARPQKTGLDYFPHDCDASSDDKVDVLITMFGNDGYAFYFRLLERIYKSEDRFFIPEMTRQILARKLAVSDERFGDMLETAFKVGCFDRREFTESERLTSNGIRKRVEIVIAERARKRSWHINKGSEDGFGGQNKGSEDGFGGQNYGETPQRKVKESKGNISKDINTKKVQVPKKEQSPLLQDCEYFRATDHELETAKKTWISNGKPAEDFKLAIAMVEFWLGGKSTEAIKARSNPSHARQLHATWVMRKVNEELEERAKTQQRITGAPIRSQQQMSRKEKSRADLLELIRETEHENEQPLNVTPGFPL